MSHSCFRDKGTPVDNICNYSSEKEQAIYVDCLTGIRDKKLVFATKAGMVKVVDGSEFDVTKRTVAATKLSGEEDLLMLVGIAEMNDYLVLQSAGGYFLKFLLEEIPEKKRQPSASGESASARTIRWKPRTCWPAGLISRSITKTESWS